MIENFFIGNIREGSHAGTLALSVMFGPGTLPKDELEKFYKVFDQWAKKTPTIYLYVQRTATEPQVENVLGTLWAIYARTHRIIVCAHEQRNRAWFSWAHWLVLKTSFERFSGVMASEYHVMLTEAELEPDSRIVLLGQTLLYVVGAPGTPNEKLVEWAVAHGGDVRILSPQKLSIVEDIKF